MNHHWTAAQAWPCLWTVHHDRSGDGRQIVSEMVAVMADPWHTIDTAPADELVMTRIDDAAGARNEQPMLRRGNLWFINPGEPGEMYVYYAPTHWRRGAA